MRSGLTWDGLVGDGQARTGALRVSSPPPGQWSLPPNQPTGAQTSSGPPPGQNRRTTAARWLVGGLALLAAIVITVVATLLITRNSSGSEATTPVQGPQSSSVDESEMASAADDGPVGLITEDPTCAPWTPIAETFSKEAAKGWNDRDASVPSNLWSLEQRRLHEAISKAMRSAADESVALVKLTPHRVMRELYEQTIAYWRAYADAIPNYSGSDDYLARTATAASNAINYICSAITYNSAAARAPLVTPSPAAYGAGNLEDPANPTRYINEPLPVCGDWISAAETFDNETDEWFRTDPNIPSSQWSPEQQQVFQRTAPIMQSSAGEVQNLGAQSLNSVFDDLAALSSQYRKAYVRSFPTYVAADAYLANAAAELVATNAHACRAVGVS